MKEPAMKTPVVAATTSLSLLAVSIFGLPTTTSAMDQSFYIESPSAYIRHMPNRFDSSTVTDVAMSYEKTQALAECVKFAAYEMFGEMRNSTLEENNLYEGMLARMSRPVDVNILSL